MIRFFVYIFIISTIIFIPFKINSESKKQVKVGTSVVHVKLVEPKKPKVNKKPKKKIIKKKPKKKPKPKKPKPKPKPKKKVFVPQEKPQEIKPLEEEIIEEAIKSEVVENVQAVNQTLIDEYYNMIYEKINSHKRYPKKAIRFRREDSIPVHFAIDKDGLIYEFKILKKSKYSSLNKAVEKIFKKIKRVDRPPNGIETPLKINISINFKLKKG